jgi:hypothetical protein
MSDKQEAWEVIAGELPPGYTWASAKGDVRGRVLRGEYIVATGYTREQAAVVAWAVWRAESGITRRRYAEDIAPRRVREVAEAVWADDLDRVDIGLRGGTAMVVVMVWGPWGRETGSGRERQSVMQAYGSGPDICTAAWASMLAMTEKMPEAERAELLGVSVEMLRDALEVE